MDPRRGEKAYTHRLDEVGHLPTGNGHVEGSCVLSECSSVEWKWEKA